MDEKKPRFVRRAISVIWWFKLPIVPFALYCGLFALFLNIPWARLFPALAHSGFSISIAEAFTAVSSAVLAMWIIYRFCEHRSMRESGFDTTKWLNDLGVGCLLGIGLVVAMVVGLCLSGVYHFVSFSPKFHPFPMLEMLAIFFLAALFEEVVFRLFIFQTAERRLGTVWAFVIACVLFGLVHLVNPVPGATPQEKLLGCIYLIFEAGIVLNAAFLIRRTVWLPLGLHWTWNFFEGPVFGMNVSGTTQPTQLIEAKIQGSNFLTGGYFGPEASISGLLVGAFCGIAILLYIRANRPSAAEISSPPG